MKKITIGMADDNSLIRHGIAHLLSQTPDLSLFWQGNGRAWITLLEQHPPDLLLIDFAMPMREELEITSYIHTYHPHVKVVVFSAHYDEAHRLAMIEAGASGYISKAAKPAEILSALRMVAEGSYNVDSQANPSMPATEPLEEPDKNLLMLSQQLAKISLRERAVLQQMAEGKTCPEIADLLFISKDTVRNHKANISQKLNLKGRNQLFVLALAMKSMLKETDLLMDSNMREK